MDLENRIMQQIREDSVRPRPRWLFVLGDFGRGAEAVLWMAVGALSFALAILLFFEGRILGSLFIIGIWIACFSIGIFREYRDMVRMRNFALYRFGALPLASFLFFVNGALGYTVFQTGQAEKVEQKLEQLPVYQALKADPENKERKEPAAVPAPAEKREKKIEKNNKEEAEEKQDETERQDEEADENPVPGNRNLKDGYEMEDREDGEVRGASDRKNGSPDKNKDEKKKEEPQSIEDEGDEGESSEVEDEESEEDLEGERMEN